MVGIVMRGMLQRLMSLARPASRSRLPAISGVAIVGGLALLAAGLQPLMRPVPPGAGSGPARRATAGHGTADHGAADHGTRHAPGSSATDRDASAFRRIILPDLLIVTPQGLSAGQVARLRALTGVRNMITFDGAEITAGGQPVSVIGVSAAQFRSWVPLRTASDQAIWTDLANGGFAASIAASRRLRLHAGDSYQLTGTTSQVLRFGAAAQFGVAGVDLLVNTAQSRALGLVHRVAGLISAPGAGLAGLIRSVRAVLGPSGKIISLRTEQLPQAPARPGQLPGSSLQLFQDSAALYCPGLSWTVLAAIGQIESADGTNVGPSTAGALGPMQFLPSTWAVWGTDGFGLTGPPDVMNPYDAVPSAARLLCADGAAAGGQSLRQAVFDYNHAGWYVNEVLALAAQYAADYR
jgi:hypothetical protein